MVQDKSAQPSPCQAVGTLIFKNHCYALRDEDGAETWLELDMAPAHLIDHAVRVEGELYAHSHIWVDRIGPVN